MAGQVISFVIGAIIVYLAVKVLIKTFRDTKSGKCAGCSGHCASCEFREKSLRGDNERDYDEEPHDEGATDKQNDGEGST